MQTLVLPAQSQTTLSNTVEYNSLEEKVHALIWRDLRKLGWTIKYPENKNGAIKLSPPETYNRTVIKTSMEVKRQEIIRQYRGWINNNIEIARDNLADGVSVLKSKIEPIIEVCETKKQHDLFRILRFYWSSPYSEYVGRRIKLIIRDGGLPNRPVIGIVALGSPIIHIPERDDWIGWDKNTRTKNLNYTMDAYVIGALPPYNRLLGGKLVSYLLASKKVRSVFEKKYGDTKYNKLAGIFTTSLYGRSSQYNRMKLKDKLLYQPIGSTKGYGTLHLTNETFNAMNQYLKENGIFISNKFGAGPSWRMRVIRTAGNLLGFDSNLLLRHSFKRNIYYIDLARNSIDFLHGDSETLNNFQYSTEELTAYWKKRWFEQRLNHNFIVQDVKKIQAESFCIE